MGKTKFRRLLKAFTFIEVMAAAAVLALGIVFIYEALFVSLDAFGDCRAYLNFGFWADEKLWAAQDNLGRFGSLVGMAKEEGILRRANREAKWDLVYSLIGTDPDLYRITLNLYWRGSRKREGLLRFAYAIYEEKK